MIGWLGSVPSIRDGRLKVLDLAKNVFVVLLRDRGYRIQPLRVVVCCRREAIHSQRDLLKLPFHLLETGEQTGIATLWFLLFVRLLGREPLLDSRCNRLHLMTECHHLAFEICKIGGERLVPSRVPMLQLRLKGLLQLRGELLAQVLDFCLVTSDPFVRALGCSGLHRFERVVEMVKRSLDRLDSRFVLFLDAPHPLDGVLSRCSYRRRILGNARFSRTGDRLWRDRDGIAFEKFLRPHDRGQRFGAAGWNNDNPPTSDIEFGWFVDQPLFYKPACNLRRIRGLEKGKSLPEGKGGVAQCSGFWETEGRLRVRSDRALGSPDRDSPLDAGLCVSPKNLPKAPVCSIDRRTSCCLRCHLHGSEWERERTDGPIRVYRPHTQDLLQEIWPRRQVFKESPGISIGGEEVGMSSQESSTGNSIKKRPKPAEEVFFASPFCEGV